MRTRLQDAHRSRARDRVELGPEFRNQSKLVPTKGQLGHKMAAYCKNGLAEALKSCGSPELRQSGRSDGFT